jgi:hypothetical protein
MAGGGGGIQSLGQPDTGQTPGLGAPNFFSGGTPLLGGWGALPQPGVNNGPNGGGGWSPQPQPQVSNDPQQHQQLWQTRQMDPNSPFYNPNARAGNPIRGTLQQQGMAPLWQRRQNDPNSPFYKPSMSGYQG